MPRVEMERSKAREREEGGEREGGRPGVLILARAGSGATDDARERPGLAMAGRRNRGEDDPVTVLLGAPWPFIFLFLRVLFPFVFLFYN